MRLFWNGKDITESVSIVECVARDYSGGRSDCLDLTLEDSAKWFRWAPEDDDEIVLTEGTYSTGRMFLSAIAPEGTRYRVLAASLPKSAARGAWQNWNGVTLGNLFEALAAECGFGAEIYGIESGLLYTYLLRQYDAPAEMLARIGEWEGMMVKAYDGRMRGIGIEWAQQRKPSATLKLDAESAEYRNLTRYKWTGVTVQSPWASASARDTAVTAGSEMVFPNLPARTAEQAGRWARGILLCHNRKAETLEVSGELNTDLLAMARVDVNADGAMGGKWIVDEAEHDFINKTTRVKLERVIETVR